LATNGYGSWSNPNKTREKSLRKIRKNFEGVKRDRNLSKITLNPRLVKIYELLRGFGLSEIQATVLASRTFKALPKESQIATEAEIDDLVNSRR
jgi:hypothetical protein